MTTIETLFVHLALTEADQVVVTTAGFNMLQACEPLTSRDVDRMSEAGLMTVGARTLDAFISWFEDMSGQDQEVGLTEALIGTLTD